MSRTVAQATGRPRAARGQRCGVDDRAGGIGRPVDAVGADAGQHAAVTPARASALGRGQRELLVAAAAAAARRPGPSSRRSRRRTPGGAATRPASSHAARVRSRPLSRASPTTGVVDHAERDSHGAPPRLPRRASRRAGRRSRVVVGARQPRIARLRRLRPLAARARPRGAITTAAGYASHPAEPLEHAPAHRA